MPTVHSTPQINLRVLLAEPNPVIDLKLTHVENSMESFRNALKHHKNRTMAQVTERRALQTQEKKKNEEKCQAIRTEIEQCKLDEIQLLETLSSEQKDRKEAELAVSGLKRELGTLRERLEEIDKEIAQLRSYNTNLSKDRGRESNTLHQRASSIQPEVQFCEEALSLSIEGLSNHNLLFTFTNVDESDPEREFSLVLDVSGDDYRVPTSNPLLAPLQSIVTNLNETRNLAAFLIHVRRAFVASLT
ncbi:chromosome segregation protein Spc25-domain-containing protein [Flagelloscypha sp. PMI_526]|nr:chromosome segregation protein Spc25-domain-containing protein [Flagelloscypha sp. PMI_526]